MTNIELVIANLACEADMVYYVHLQCDSGLWYARIDNEYGRTQIKRSVGALATKACTSMNEALAELEVLCA